ncbi:alpha/beta fold hydrolase [Leifsonia sp. NPDC102414]|uniref:alpha/beta fold hydrolase n=1 Tax=Leifsonia sp. NPDC102414 TaxID=3364124 RepID=UPI003814C6F5
MTTSPRLVYLPGLTLGPTDSRMSDRLVDHLILRDVKRQFELTAVTPPALQQGATMAQVAALYANSIRRLGSTPQPLIGFSSGASIALQITLDFPELVSGLILVAGGARLGERGRVAQSDLMTSDGPPGRCAAARFMSASVSPPMRPIVRGIAGLATRRSISAQASALIRAEDSFDVLHRLEGISVPTLVIAGEWDLFYPPEVTRETASRIPAGELRLYKRRSHAALPFTPAVGRDIASFVSRHLIPERVFRNE